MYHTIADQAKPPITVQTLPNGVRLVRRAAWGALPPRKAPAPQPSPVNTIIVQHTATGSCFSLDSCAKMVSTVDQPRTYL